MNPHRSGGARLTNRLRQGSCQGGDNNTELASAYARNEEITWTGRRHVGAHEATHSSAWYQIADDLAHHLVLHDKTLAGPRPITGADPRSRGYFGAFNSVCGLARLCMELIHAQAGRPSLELGKPLELASGTPSDRAYRAAFIIDRACHTHPAYFPGFDLDSIEKDFGVTLVEIVSSLRDCVDLARKQPVALESARIGAEDEARNHPPDTAETTPRAVESGSQITEPASGEITAHSEAEPTGDDRLSREYGGAGLAELRNPKTRPTMDPIDAAIIRCYQYWSDENEERQRQGKKTLQPPGCAKIADYVRTRREVDPALDEALKKAGASKVSHPWVQKRIKKLDKEGLLTYRMEMARFSGAQVDLDRVSSERGLVRN